MARMMIPPVKAPVAAPTPQQSGPVVVGGVEPADEAMPIGLSATEDIGSLDVKPAVTEQTQQAPQQHAPLSPQLSSDNIARVEELARSIVEVRAIAVGTESEVKHTLNPQLQSLKAAVQNLHGETSLLRDLLSNGVKLPADIAALPQRLSDAVATLSQRLNSIDAVLESRGLPTSQSAPTVKLTQMRRLVHPARVIDGVVTLFYNPRQGENGAVDPQDFPLSRDNVRKVWCGYRIEVPIGYIADIFVGNDLISSMSGRRDAEEILALRTNGTNMTISSGQPIARLLLRKVEAAALEIEVQK